MSPDEKKPEDMIREIHTYLIGVDGKDGFIDRTCKRLDRLEKATIVIALSMAAAGIGIYGI